MTKAEKIAYSAGQTAAARGLEDKAPCYDPLMGNLITESRSKSGIERNLKILAAWYHGAGREIPTGE